MKKLLHFIWVITINSYLFAWDDPVYLTDSLANNYEPVISYVNFYEGEIQNLYSKKDSLEKIRSEKESTDIHNVCDYEILKSLSEYIEKRLVRWDYNENPKVVFDSAFTKFDIVISNKGRGSYGKGRRAISYTACLLGFLDFCISEQKSFSNLIIIDSPLTTFKDKETEEEDFESIDDQFFEDFRQLENYLTRRYEGMGLGLAVARRTALFLGGNIKLDVREDGNTFRILLPLDSVQD